MYLRVPLLRSASLARQGFPSAMPMAARGPASPRNELSCSRGTERRQIRQGRRRGRPRAGEASARARQHETPGRFAAAAPPPGGRGGPDARKVGARRGAVGTASIHGETEVANVRVEHPKRAASAGDQVRAADAHPATGPTRRARRQRAVTAHAAPTACVARATAANRKERAGVEVLRPPRWFTYVSSFAGSLDLGTTPGTSFAGVHGSEGGPDAGATRASRRLHPRRGVPDEG